MKFLSSILLSLGMCALAYGSLAYFVNPRGYFTPTSFPEVVLPDRQEKLRLFENFVRQGPVTGLVLGSSRSMKLEPSALNRAFGGRFFNFAVTAATVEDYGTIYGWVRRQHITPQRLIIGLDLEAIHSDDQINNVVNILELRTELEGAKKTTVRDRLDRLEWSISTVFTFDYLTDALQSIGLKLKPQPPQWSFNADGYVRYQISESERAQGVFDYAKAMKGCAIKYQARYKAMTGLSQGRLDYLEALIQRAEGDGVRVIVWITPLHPDALPEVTRDTDYMQLMNEALAYVERLRLEHHITVVDLHDPLTFGTNGTYWYDCVHYDEPSAQRIITRLASQP
jgi:hypothetical protein